MKYALNDSPIAGPRRHIGQGTAALAVSPTLAGTVGVSGSGAAALAMTPAGAGTIGTPGAGVAALAIDTLDRSVKPIGVKGEGAAALALDARHRFVFDPAPREGFEPVPGRTVFRVQPGSSGFTVPPDSVDPVREPEGFTVPDQGGR